MANTATSVSAKSLIEIESIIVAYAMSRLDTRFLSQLGYRSWRAAFTDTGRRLGRKPSSLKNLRDEFDPVHGNARAGWNMRPMRPNRQRVLGEFCTVSDAALVEVVRRILNADGEVRAELSQPLLAGTPRSENVAERLRTGREAEQFFLDNTEAICGVPRKKIVDVRNEARGFDFAVADRTALGIEVKGMRLGRGDVLFTDHEWNQARRRAADYWLVVVGRLDDAPQALLMPNPCAHLDAKSVLRQAVAVSWRARVHVA